MGAFASICSAVNGLSCMVQIVIYALALYGAMSLYQQIFGTEQYGDSYFGATKRNLTGGGVGALHGGGPGNS